VDQLPVDLGLRQFAAGLSWLTGDAVLQELTCLRSAA
jgi:hypothetical protein